MKQLLRQWLSQLRGISTPFGGISWGAASPALTVRTFSDAICVTSSGNQKFISFLKANIGRIVFLRAHIDACVATEESYRIIQQGELDIDRIASGSFGGMPLPLPNEAGELISVTFYFSEGHPLNYSAGGTGVVMIDVTGFFQISRTVYGGPSMMFHLREFDAPLEFRVNFVNREDIR